MITATLAEPARTLRALGSLEGGTLLREGTCEVKVMASEAELAMWDRFADAHPLSRAVFPMYSIAAGWRPVRLGLFEHGALVGGLFLVVRRVPNLPFSASRILYAMIGPHDHAAMLDRLLEGAEIFAITKLIVETEVQLRIPANNTAPGFEWSAELLPVLEKYGYRRLARVDRTYFVRIDRSDEEMLASFGQQPRNRIRKAMKSGAAIECTNDPALLDDFYEAYAGTSERKHVRGTLPRAVVVRGFRPLLESGRALMFAERYGETLANMVIVDPLGTPCAMLASRSRESIDGKSPSFAQLVHFTAMRAMRDRGHRWYDFGGCEGPVPIECHPNYGVWHFKHAFKGTYVTFLPYMRKIRGDVARPIITLLHRHRGDPVSLG